MSDRYSRIPAGPDYFMEVGVDDNRAESTVGPSYDHFAEPVWPTAHHPSAVAGDRAPEFEI